MNSNLRIIGLCLAGAILVSMTSLSLAQRVPGQYIAVFQANEGDPENAARGLARQFGVSVSGVYKHSIRGFAFAGSEQAAEALARNPRIAYVEQDQWCFTTSVHVTIPTGVRRIGINDDWLEVVAPSRQPVAGRIAILDTGLDWNHPDLNIDPDGVRFYEVTVTTGQGKNKQTYKEIRSDDQWQDVHGHGTHVGGTAGANGQIVGVAPGALLTAVKVLSDQGSAPGSVVIAGIDWVAANSHRFDVANMSLGGGFSQALNDAVRGATEAGVVMVVSAGNAASDASKMSPASEPAAITVSAMADFDGLPGALSSSTWSFTSSACQDPATGESIPTTDDTRVCWSNWGPLVDICAPGARIYSTYPNGTYYTMSGTSMAAPHVAGAAALYIAFNREALAGLTGSTRVEHVTDVLKTGGWQFGDHGYFSGDEDGFPEPLLNVRPLLGAGRPDLQVTITAPEHEQTFEPGASISFSATATASGVDAAGEILWVSSRDGLLSAESGGSISASLSEGAHIITASITDPGSAFSGLDSVTIIVGEGEIVDPGPKQLFLQISTDKDEYVNNETMRSTFLVTWLDENGSPVEGVSINGAMIDAKGGRWTVTGTTDADGLFVALWKVNTGRGGKGTYTINATATRTGWYDATASTTFIVK
jgi:subtilisin